MGITVVLEKENGTPLASVEDPTNVLHRVLPSRENELFQVLRFIDWYGDTVINRLQLELFMDEWSRISGRTKEEKELLSRIMDLARRALSEQHTYLKFYGD